MSRRLLAFVLAAILTVPVAPGFSGNVASSLYGKEPKSTDVSAELESIPDEDVLDWPEASGQSRPRARWWWLGSAVDRESLTKILRQYQKAGFGGVEICPIYGTKGYEDRYLDFLSPRWNEMLRHTLAEGDRLGLSIDLTTGTGWPFGGPNVSTEDASSGLTLKEYEVRASRVEERLPEGHLLCLVAAEEDGKVIDLADRVEDGRFQWDVPQGTWRVYAVLQRPGVQKVKRAAPGGEGYVLDPYSTEALERYLKRFDAALDEMEDLQPQTHFHDSFEYYGATWSAYFFHEFRGRRGYDLRDHLAALFGDGSQDTAARVKYDYRLTIAELHLAYVNRWTEWAHGHGSLTRNQAHGAPGVLLDLYAAADIPETENFRGIEDRQRPTLQFAASAAHVSGRKLVSAEAFTWGGEHFQTALADLKSIADGLFLSGVNRLVYHGIPYSPPDAD